MGNILFVAPHPDDETLGCGGTILKHKDNGDKIYWMIMTNISTAAGYDEARVIERQEEIDKVAKEFGFEDVFKLDLPATKLDIEPTGKIIGMIVDVIQEIKPEVVYIPYRNDVHSDHKITFDAVCSSTKTFRHPYIKKIMVYEVVSETEFAPSFQNNAFCPNGFSDISKYLDKKISIMVLYKGETAQHPFPRSIDNIKALATFRGATTGVNYAEAFMILKERW